MDVHFSHCMIWLGQYTKERSVVNLIIYRCHKLSIFIPVYFHHILICNVRSNDTCRYILMLTTGPRRKVFYSYPHVFHGYKTNFLRYLKIYTKNTPTYAIQEQQRQTDNFFRVVAHCFIHTVW